MRQHREPSPRHNRRASLPYPMPGESTLIVTTRSGVRPLGVRGEPLHNAAPQLRRVVRRRLGDAAADLLADPQLARGRHGDRLVRRLVRRRPPPSPISTPARRAEVLAERRAHAGRDPAPGRHAGRRRPARGHRPGRPVAEAGGAGALALLRLPGRRPAGHRRLGLREGSGHRPAAARSPRARCRAAARSSSRRPVLEATAEPPPSRCRRVQSRPPSFPGAHARRSPCRCFCSSCWRARGCCAAAARPIPTLTLATREGPPAPPAPPAPPDPLPVLKASFSTEQSRKASPAGRTVAGRGRAEAAHRRLQAAGTAQEPPQVAAGRRRHRHRRPPAAPPKAAPPKPPPAPHRATAAQSRRRPPAPARADQRLCRFLQGCWRTDPFRHETRPAAARRLVLLLRRQRQRPARMAARPHRLPHARPGALRGRGAAPARRRHDLQRRLALVRRPARLPARRRRCRAMQRPVARRHVRPVTWTVNLHKLN